MRVSVCKPYCPSICFLKSSTALHSPCTLKIEDVQQTSPTPISNSLEEKVSDEKIEVEKDRTEDGKVEAVLKSCLKKPSQLQSEEVEKGKVKWMDFVGKELVEIREFEPMDLGESEDRSEGNQLCVCVIQ